MEISLRFQKDSGHQLGPQAGRWLWLVAALSFSAFPVWIALIEPERLAAEGTWRLLYGLSWTNLVLFVAFAWCSRPWLTGLRMPAATAATLVALLATAMARLPMPAFLTSIAVALFVPSVIAAGLILRQLNLEAPSKLFGGATRRVDRVAPVVPLAVLVAGTVAQGWSGNIETAATVAATLASAFATPALFLSWAATWEAATSIMRRRAIRCSDPGALFRLGQVQAISFDGLDSLATRNLRVVAVHPAPNTKAAELLAIAAGLHQSRNDDVSRAIMDFGVARHLSLAKIEAAKEGESNLAAGRIEGSDRHITSGSFDALQGLGIDLSPMEAAITHNATLGRQMLFLAELEPEQRVMGGIAFAHPPRKGSIETIKTLRQRGFDVGLELGQDDQPGLQATLGLLGLKDAVGAEPQVDGEVAKVKRRTIASHCSKGGMEIFVQDNQPVAQINREDPRTIVDLLNIAHIAAGKFRQFGMTAVVAAIAIAVAGLVLPADAPMIITLGGLFGLVLVSVAPQALRGVPMIGSEVDEED